MGTADLIQNVVQTLVGSTLVFENILLVFIVLTTPQLHTTKYIFTGSLAVTDTLIGLTCIIAIELPVIDEAKSKSGFASTVLATLIVTMFVHSLLHMTAIAIERYLYIAHPFFYERRMTTKVIRWIIVGLWAFTLFVEIFLVVFHVSILGVYVPTLNTINEYVLLVGVCFFYTSITMVTCACYVLILCQVRKHRRAVGAQEVTKEKASKTKDVIKSIKFFLCMFGFYFFMSTPAIMVEALPNVFNVHADIRFYLVFIAASNSGVNFIILNVFDRVFRDILKKRLAHFLHRFCSCCCKRKF